MWLQYSILVCFVAATIAAPGPSPKLRPSRLAKTDNNVCTTKVCEETASSLKQAMDSSVDPCDDFYKYACGNYERNVPAQITSYNRFAELQVGNLKKLKALFEEPHTSQDPAMYKKVKDFYASCTNANQIQQVSSKPLLRLLKRLGGWPVIESFWNEWTSDSWQNILYKLWQSGLGYNYLFKMELGVDFQNTTYRPVTLGFPELTLSLNALASGPLSDEYNQHFNSLVRIAETLGANPYQAVNDMQNVLRLERALFQAAFGAKSQDTTNNITLGQKRKIGIEPKGMKSNLFSTDYARLEKQAEMLYEVEMGRLIKLLPSVKWNLFFQNALQTNSLKGLRIYTANPNYVTKAIQILDGSSKRIVLNYFLLRALLDTEIALEAKDEDKRDFICTEEVEQKLPLIVGNMYLNKIFKSETKEVADEMVAKLRSIFQKRMTSESWMDDATRQKAIDKLLNVKQDVAYPREAIDTGLLENLHQPVTIRNNAYFENRLTALRFLHEMEMAPFSQNHKAADWYRKASSVTLVNANYYSLANTIWMPAAILQGAFFNADRPQSMNFGAVGAVIGHEFTHGFDTTGRLFTKDGVMAEWWSAATIQKFDEKAKCLVDQFSSQYVPELGRPLDGEKTVGENIADNGGFTQAYKAYLEWTRNNEPEPLLPGLDLNHQQLFWLSNANVWCEKISKENLEEIVKNDVHSPNRYRVNLGFQNFEEFAKDFSCTATSPMNPGNKCHVW